MVNNSTRSHYYSQTEFEYFTDKFDDDNAEVYTVMQRLFREGSVMKKAGLGNMKMGELKRSSELKKELFLRMRDAIPKAPLNVDYKARQDALKNRLAQRGIFGSSMKYKSKYGNYYSYDNDKIGFPFFVEVAVFNSNNITRNLYYVNALNNAVMPGDWSYLHGSYSDTFLWHTEADREKVTILVPLSLCSMKFPEVKLNSKILLLSTAISPTHITCSYHKEGIEA